MPMQYIEFSEAIKNENFQKKNFDTSSKNKKYIKSFQLKIFQFLQLKKYLYFAWASFRNELLIEGQMSTQVYHKLIS